MGSKFVNLQNSIEMLVYPLVQSRTYFSVLVLLSNGNYQRKTTFRTLSTLKVNEVVGVDEMYIRLISYIYYNAKLAKSNFYQQSAEKLDTLSNVTGMTQQQNSHRYYFESSLFLRKIYGEVITNAQTLSVMQWFIELSQSEDKSARKL